MVTIFFFGDIFGCNVHGILHHRFSNSIGIIPSMAGVFPQLSIVSQSSISRSTTSSSWLMYPIISSLVLGSSLKASNKLFTTLSIQLSFSESLRFFQLISSNIPVWSFRIAWFPSSFGLGCVSVGGISLFVEVCGLTLISDEVGSVGSS